MERIQFTAYADLCCKITITMNHLEVLRNFLVGSFDFWEALPHLSALFFVPPPSLPFKKDWQDFYVMLKASLNTIFICNITMRFFCSIMHEANCRQERFGSYWRKIPITWKLNRGSLINLIDYQVGFSFHYICSAADVYLFFLKRL